MAVPLDRITIRLGKGKDKRLEGQTDVLFFLGGQVVYFVYGVRIRQWPLIVGMAANLAGSIAVIASALRFRARK